MLVLFTRCVLPPGFNCAEAVNFGPPDWLPYGTDRAQKYRKDWKPLTLSHDALLVTLATSAGAAAAAARARGEDLSSVSLPPLSVAAEAVPLHVSHKYNRVSFLVKGWETRGSELSSGFCTA